MMAIDNVKKHKILILGSNGMIGHKLYQNLSPIFDVWCTFRDQIPSLYGDNFYNIDKIIKLPDLSNFSALSSILEDLNPDIVINASGITIRRGINDNLNLSYSMNSILPQILDRWAYIKSKWVIHFSTDCVFSGVKGNYVDFDKPDAIDIYGHSKSIGESNLLQTLVLRGSYIGRELSNRTELLEWLISNNNNNIYGYSNVIYSGTTTVRISEYVKILIEDHYGLTGIYNVSSFPISKYDLLALLIKKFNLNIQVENNKDYHSNKNLVSDKFFKLINKNRPNWNDLSDELKLDSDRYNKLYK